MSTKIASDLKLFKLPEWFGKINTADSILPLVTWDGVVRHYLEPLEEGAILCWTFSNPANPDVSQLFVKLTEGEAESIASVDLRTTGMIEPVRSQLSDTEALIFTYRDGDDSRTGVMPYLIKRQTSESGLSRSLDAAATLAAGWWADMKTEAEEHISDLSRQIKKESRSQGSSKPQAFQQTKNRLREVEGMPKRIHASS